jgi:hypothetical protein
MNKIIFSLKSRRFAMLQEDGWLKNLSNEKKETALYINELNEEDAISFIKASILWILISAVAWAIINTIIRVWWIQDLINIPLLLFSGSMAIQIHGKLKFFGIKKISSVMFSTTIWIVCYLVVREILFKLIFNLNSWI